MSVVITVVIMLGLGVLAAVHRQHTPVLASPDGTPLSATGSVSPISLTTDDLPANPLDPPPKAEWEVLPSCRILENKMNAAHSFHVTRGGDPFVFQLYGVKSPEATGPSDDEVAEESRYFGLSEHLSQDQCAEKLGRLGQQAWTAVEQLLERPFIVLTRWERRTDSHYFYAFVYFKDDHGNRRFLQDWLVEQGYATIARSSLGQLPNGQKAERFFEDLEALEQTAQQRRNGAWGLLSGKN